MKLIIKFYTKPKCSLCERARDLLDQLQKCYPFDTEEMDILSDPALYEQYKYEIPVISFPDQTQLKGRIDREQLKNKIDQVLKFLPLHLP